MPAPHAILFPSQYSVPRLEKTHTHRDTVREESYRSLPPDSCTLHRGASLTSISRSQVRSLSKDSFVHEPAIHEDDDAHGSVRLAPR